jgi:hypothetical protein
MNKHIYTYNINKIHHLNPFKSPLNPLIFPPGPAGCQAFKSMRSEEHQRTAALTWSLATWKITIFDR